MEQTTGQNREPSDPTDIPAGEQGEVGFVSSKDGTVSPTPLSRRAFSTQDY